jgi:hypothetical protein
MVRCSKVLRRTHNETPKVNFVTKGDLNRYPDSNQRAVRPSQSAGRWRNCLGIAMEWQGSNRGEIEKWPI